MLARMLGREAAALNRGTFEDVEHEHLGATWQAALVRPSGLVSISGMNVGGALSGDTRLGAALGDNPVRKTSLAE